MYIGTHQRSIRYDPKDILDSKIQRNINSSNFVTNVSVGGTICIDRPTNIIITTEIFGPVIIDRYYLNFNKNLIPLYVKIYDTATAQSSVLLLRKGIVEAKKLFGDTIANAMFTKHILLSHVFDELENIDPFFINEARDLPYGNYFDNDIANNETEVILYPNSNLAEGYPWDLANILTPSVQSCLIKREQSRPMRLAKNISDLSVHVCISERDIHSFNLMSELSDIVSPSFTDTYDPFILDRATRQMMNHEQLNVREVVNAHGIQQNYFIPTLPVNKEIWNDFTKLVKFSSELMSLCVFLQQLPFIEISCKYILLKRDLGRIADKLTIEYSYPCYEQDVELSLKGGLSRIVNLWSLDIAEIWFVRTRYDELYLATRSKSWDIQKYYIDLSVLTILTQAMATEVDTTLPGEIWS